MHNRFFASLVCAVVLASASHADADTVPFSSNVPCGHPWRYVSTRTADYHSTNPPWTNYQLYEGFGYGTFCDYPNTYYYMTNAGEWRTCRSCVVCVEGCSGFCSNVDSNLLRPRSAHACTFSSCGKSYPETCNGLDDDGNGQVDEGVCGAADVAPCINHRTDPVHVGTGAFLTDPVVDFEFHGSPLPLAFSRTYTSYDNWGDSSPGAYGTLDSVLMHHSTRLSRGWFSQFDERLFGGDGYSPIARPSAATPGVPTKIVHRTASGIGRQFSCTFPNNADSVETRCSLATDDGSFDVLYWKPGSSTWEVHGGGGVTTSFLSDGSLSGKHDSHGRGWSVGYDSSGAYAGYLTSARDHLGRTLTFVWSINASGVGQLTSLRVGSRQVAEYGYLAPLGSTSVPSYLLTSASGISGSESYSYFNQTPGTIPYDAPLAQITRDGQVAVSVTYGTPVEGGGGVLRVASIEAADGSFEFRYASDANNLCENPAASTMIVDRSTLPLGSISCSLDGDCAGSDLSACDSMSHVCRAYACQEYAATLPDGRVDFERPTTIAGNCPCGNAASLSWSSEMPGGRQIVAKHNRDGSYTTFAYEPSTGRMLASCDGDNDGALASDDPSTCPASGVWRSYSYDANWQALVSQIQERSGVLANKLHTTSFIYGTMHPDLMTRVERGYSLDDSGAPTELVLVTQFGYDINSGQIVSISEPYGRLTNFQYYPPGSGNNSGMLKQRDVRVGLTPTVLWQSTAYSGYTEFGQPTNIVLPSGATRTDSYDLGTGRRISTTLGADTTAFDYYASGRLKQVTGPSGRVVLFEYDAQGRISRRYDYDSSETDGSGYNTTYFWYDAAGRIINTAVYQLDSSWTFRIVQFWSTEYNSTGNPVTTREGGATTEQRVYDPNGMGLLEEVDRIDGDRETFEDHDHFGRPRSWTRMISGSTASQFSASYASLATGNADATSPPTQVIDPQGRQWKYTYDDFGNLVKSESPGMGTSRWVYASGLVSDTYFATGAHSHYQYDVAGRLSSEDHNYGSTTARGQDYTYRYDEDGTSVSCPFTTVSGFYSYAPCLYRKGQLAQVTVEASPGVTWSIFRDYTLEGNVRSDRYVDGSQVDYQYAPGGRLLRTRLPWGGYRIRNDYDANPGDSELPTMISRVVMENNAGGEVFTWARSMMHDGLGRLASAYLADNASSTTPSIGIARRSNGRISSMQIYSGSGLGGSSGNIVDNRYAYYGDLMLKSITNAAGAGRFFYYDGANRLTCDATTGAGCPANGNAALVAAYAYDTADNRTSSGSPASTSSTIYTYPTPGPVSPPELQSVLLPGGRTVVYSHYADGSRYIDSETTSGVATNTRNLYYDGIGRLNSVRITDAVAGAVAGTIQSHVINVWYDPWSRPVYVNSLNTSTSVTEGYRYYWSYDGRLLAIKHTPNMASGANYDVDEYVDIGPVVGIQRLRYVNSSIASTGRWYLARSHNGQPIASWSATSPYAETWRATRTSAFGEVLAETGDPSMRGPWGFLGHVQVPDSSVEVWNGSMLEQRRPSLYMTNWRTYDPMLGAWTAPEPARWEGWLPFGPAYTYANAAPTSYVDVDGRFPWILFGYAALAAAAVFLEDDRPSGEPHLTQLLEVRESAERQTRGLDGEWLGLGDAMRHCVASCEMTKRYGEETAKTCGDMNELHLIPNTRLDREQDYQNNAIGRSIGATNPSSCYDECMAAPLRTLNESELDQVHSNPYGP